MALRLTTASNEILCGCQDFVYQFGGRRLRIRAQQRLRSRSTKQDPRFRAIAIRRRIEKKFDAVKICFFYDAIASKRLRGIRASPLNRTLLDVFGNVQIAAAVIVWTKLVLQIRTPSRSGKKRE
jgi:hypothetical protein